MNVNVKTVDSKKKDQKNTNSMLDMTNIQIYHNILIYSFITYNNIYRKISIVNKILIVLIFLVVE
jgi:hypothetical protein